MATRRQQLSHEQINIKGEVEYIVRRAAEHDARVVTLNLLVFFSTETGDAWMLDAGNNLALCLARDGDPQPVNITETTETFAIEWNMSYQISSDRFIITDEDADTYVMFIRGQGEALWELGRRAEAEAVYAALVERYPDKGWAHIGWSDHYWQWGAPDPKEYDRAEAILQQALVRPRLEDRNDVLDRLCSLYGEWGQKDKRAEAVAQLEQATKQADALRYFPDLPKPLSPTRPIASQPKKPGRNEPCWCGSGKKYKHGHMKADQSGEHL